MDARCLKPSQFYNKDIVKSEIISMVEAEKNASRYKSEKRRMPHRLVGPNQFWKQFNRQAEALDAAKNHSTGTDLLCTFVHQKEDGYREFVVAHPEVYWWYMMLRPTEQRCSYEVPAQYPRRMLHFGEYGHGNTRRCTLLAVLRSGIMIDLNPDRDGPNMTKTLVQIFCAYLLKYWGLPCDEKNVVNLDSTTSTKFSRHLIFCIKDVAFRNNLHVGRFVKGVCNEIAEYLENSTVLHDILSNYEMKDLEQLFVETGKNKKIFVDTGVYTRNRHFRTYKSTKLGKLAHLNVATDSKHVPLEDHGDRDLAIFMDSLISYFPNTKDLIMLEMDKDETVHAKTYAKCPNQRVHSYAQCKTSHYPELDRFVSSLIEPGKIRLCKQAEMQKLITYEVIGNRYCANIGRQHKSNNVFWIADLEKNIVYQKCHDEDCSDFKSTPITIPQEICFQMADEYDDLLLNMLEPENK